AQPSAIATNIRIGEALIIPVMEEAQRQRLVALAKTIHRPEPQCAPATTVPIHERMQKLISLVQEIWMDDRLAGVDQYAIQFPHDVIAALRSHMVSDADIHVRFPAQRLTRRSDRNKGFNIVHVEIVRREQG